MERSDYIKALRKLTWSSVDQDELLERELRALFYFFHEVLMRGPNLEREYTGCSFSQRGLNTLLVVKSVLGDIQQVAFVTAKYPIDCVVTFGKLDLDDKVKWHEDRFART